MTKGNRIMMGMWITFILMVHAFILSVGHLYFVQYNPPSVTLNSPVPVRQIEYKKGDVIELYVDYCKYVDGPATIDIQFVDGIVFPVGEPTRVNTPAGCGKGWFQLIRVPEKLPPGEYYLRIESSYQVNFLRTRSVAFKSQWFKVLPDENDLP